MKINNLQNTIYCARVDGFINFDCITPIKQRPVILPSYFTCINTISEKFVSFSVFGIFIEKLWKQTLLILIICLFNLLLLNQF
jgi:hypothetical protein